MAEAIRPQVRFLSQAAVEQIIEEAFELLEKVGLFVENEVALKLLDEAGEKIDQRRSRVFLSRNLVEKGLRSCPAEIKLYDLEGQQEYLVGQDEIHFDPGSAAIKLLDPERLEEREPRTDDLVRLYQLVETLENLDFQSTALVSADVPKEMADIYRLYLGFLFSRKPFVTGLFRVESLKPMLDLLLAIRGDEKSLAAKPLAIFDACPSPPLKWSRLTAESLIQCSRLGVPSELIPMGLTGATSPVTLAGTLVQQVAESFGGLVICQLARPGAPVIFGGSPASFDMRKGTTPMGAVETMMINGAFAQIAKHLHLPTHAYMGLSDSKLVDAQAGLETAMGATLAGLAGINVISGAGMLDFESTQSLEKLVIDNDICGQVLRLVRGVALREKPLALHLFQELGADFNFLVLPHTRKWYRQEHYFSSVLDRDVYDTWTALGRLDIFQRAGKEVSRRLNLYQRPERCREKEVELRSIMTAYARSCGLEKLPEIPGLSD
ncbi:MAG: trimethylamine methyltransferase family protein [Candidatus Saccharicenans sp.]|jgi:trimethylamine--corrinoid protein Co-methyltransferase|nr:trimethylamine methyltransferase family protein [Candidatus Saccharicenans sp.]MDH7492777.1 trimethylamine methyltransferase family protein [Candidatus Saccharicenans sp.]